jgi:hypothetical protein
MGKHQFSEHPEIGWIAEALHAASARGSYHPFRFVIQLRRDMHDLLQTIQ